MTSTDLRPSPAPPGGRWEIEPVFLLRLAGFPWRWLERLRVSEDHVAAGQAAGEDAGSDLQAASDGARAALRELASEPRVQEAVLLLSPTAFSGSLRALLASPPGKMNSDIRRREGFVALVLQRLCAKNETNAFFGPTAVGRMDGDADGLRVTWEADTRTAVRCRTAYFSHWATEAIAEVIALDPALAELRRPSLSPASIVEPDGVRFLSITAVEPARLRRTYARLRLPPPALRLLAEADGTRTAEALLDLATTWGLDRAEAAGLLEELQSHGVLLPPVPVPSGIADGLGFLRELLGTAAPGATRDRYVGAVERLVHRLETVPRGDADARAAHGVRLEAEFEELTRRPASRFPGRQYADRGLVREEAEADTDRVALGADTVERLRAPLGVACEIAWVGVARARERVRCWFRRRWPRGAVPLIEVLAELDRQPVPETACGSDAEAAIDDVARAVRTHLVEAGAGEGTVARPSRAQLDAILAGLPRGGTRAVYQSVDLMLCRPGAERGVGAVLAEMHPVFFAQPCLFAHHRDPGPMLEARRRLVRQLCDGVPAAEVVCLHTHKFDVRDRVADLDFLLAGVSPRPRAQTVTLAEVAVHLDEDGTFQFRCARHGPFVPLLTNYYMPALQLLAPVTPGNLHETERFFPAPLLPDTPAGQPSPRIEIDGLVVRRQSWTLSTFELARGLDSRDEIQLLKAAQALRARLRLGDCVFATLPGEPKPVLLDFANPFLLDVVRRMCGRSAGNVTLTEMLPAGSELALEAPDGVRTSELRLCVFRADSTSAAHPVGG